MYLSQANRFRQLAQPARNRARVSYGAGLALALIGATGLLPEAAAQAARDDSGWSVEALFAEIQDRAQALARAPHRAFSGELPPPLTGMDYDTHRSIRFDPQAALWRGLARFEVQFFHPGFLFTQPVRVHQLADGRVEEVRFDAGLFQYEGKAQALRSGVDPVPGFAGFRFHYPLNTEHYKDEVMVFLGASYFRLVGPGQVYGLSSRGIAVDTAIPGAEEFPAFREFWLVRPDAVDSSVTVLALLDGPSLTGAYRFDLHAGSEVTVDVDAHLFARAEVARLGVAPLTSMYFFGEGSVRGQDDFRPRVHDSEGLMKQTSAGEWIWRPLTNPRHFRVSSLRDRRPLGFGLVQRNRAFSAYLDLEAEYHRRPSQWVTPGAGDWGSGGVELVEIPTDSETHDNIVAAWVGDRSFAAGERRHYRYRLTVFDGIPPGSPPARAVRTRSGQGGVPGSAQPVPPGQRRFVVDFAGGDLDALPAGDFPEVRIEASSGTLEDVHARRLPNGDGWRATFLLDPEPGRAADLRLALTAGGSPLTETWNHVWYADER